MYSTDPRLQAQRAALDGFLARQSIAALLDLMKYQPWTVPSKHFNHNVAIRSSPLIGGALGLFPVKQKARTLCVYSGVLIWEELHELLTHHIHCPTAVRVDVLDYFVDDDLAKRMGLEPNAKVRANHHQVRMMLVGDPTHAGPIANSPFNLRDSDGRALLANCRLETCKAEHVNRYLKQGSHKILVSADIVQLNRLGGARFDADTELLCSYDGTDGGRTLGTGYWLEQQRHLEQNPYCELCFCKDYEPTSTSSAQHPRAFVPCSASRCLVVRHVGCIKHCSTNWRCSKHPGGITPLPAFAGHCISPVLAVKHAAAGRPAPVPAFTGLALTPPMPIPSVPATPQSRASTISMPLLVRFNAPSPCSAVRTPQPVTVSPPPARSRPIPPEMWFPEDEPGDTLDSDDDAFVLDLGFEDSPAETESDIESDVDSDGSDIEAESSLARSRRVMAVDSRTQFPRTLSLKELAAPAVTTSPEGRIALRAVWASFEGRIAKATPRAKWHIKQEHYTNDKTAERTVEKENTRIRALDKQLHQLRSCCATFDKLVEARKHPNFDHRIFDSIAALEQARLDDFHTWNFEKSLLKTHYCTLLNTTTKMVSWSNIQLCDTCLSAALGFSSSTLRRVREFDPKLETLRMPHSGRLMELISEHLKELAYSEGSMLPTATGTAGGKVEHFVLSYFTAEQCMAALTAKMTEVSGIAVNISESTFRRARRHCHDRLGVSINISKSKSLARCETCEQLDGKRKEAKRSKNRTLIEKANRLKYEHTMEWQEQRKLFQMKKDMALREPWSLWCITLDGMDQAKTHLPHYAGQLSKAAEVQRTHQLGVRVTGVFAMGAPVPCMGIIGMDDIDTKGGGASVTCIEKILDTQWEAMNPTNWAAIPEEKFDPKAASTRLRAHANLVTPPSTPAAAAAADSKPRASFMWPEGAHFTFDNTTSDCKNGHVFMFLAWMVAVGLFNYITVSLLLVGHTHDIVDQMFSVWSQKLNKNNAPTLDSMQRLFRENYDTKIYELEKLHAKLRRSKSTASHFPRTMSSASTVSSSSTASVDSQIHVRLRELSELLGIEPLVIRQQFTINSKQWCYESIVGITQPHCMYIVREGDAIVMYNRHLAGITDVGGKASLDPSVKHNSDYAEVRFGPWTTRYTLIKDIKAEMPRMSRDPFKYPVKKVDTDLVQLNILHRRHKELNMTADEYDEFDTMLRGFEHQYETMRNHCAACTKIGKELQDIGAISQGKNLTEAQKKESRSKSRKKDRLNAMRDKHLTDPEHAKKHAELVATGFWTKWLDRVKHTIRPYYLARQLIAAPTPAQAAESGRSNHPATLVSDSTEPPIVHTRVDASWAANRRPPRTGDFFVTRGSPTEPIWCGKLGLRVGESREESKDDDYEMEESEDTSRLTIAQIRTQLDNLGQTYDSKAKKPKLQDQLTLALRQAKSSPDQPAAAAPASAAAAAAPASAAAAAATSTLARPRRSAKAKVSYEEKDDDYVVDESESEESESGDESQSDDGLELAFGDDVVLADLLLQRPKSKSKSKKKSKKKSNSKQPAASKPEHKSSKEMLKRKSEAASKSTGAGARTKKQKLADAAVTADTAFHVRYFEYKQQEGIDFHDISSYENFLSLDELALFSQCVTMSSNGEFSRHPATTVNRWRHVNWLTDRLLPGSPDDQLPCSKIVLYGEKSELFRVGTREISLNERCWKRMFEDLTEATDVANNMARDTVAEVAAEERLHGVAAGEINPDAEMDDGSSPMEQ